MGRVGGASEEVLWGQQCGSMPWAGGLVSCLYCHLVDASVPLSREAEGLLEMDFLMVQQWGWGGGWGTG